MLHLIHDIPLSLYIHFPWCIKKCPYCDFNSHPLHHELPVKAYINALLADLEHNLPLITERPITSIFLGGGTPSLFAPQDIASLLQQIQTMISYKNNLEITLEANPGTLEQTYLADYLEAGINRLSIGAQSFQNEKLKALGRIHTSSNINTVLEKIIHAGFTNFNIDLMFGLPNQYINDAIFDLTSALAFKPTHLSWYQLTIEPNTAFAYQPPVLPSNEICWQIQQVGKRTLIDHGFTQYEVSAFSNPDFNCQHNLNYWQFGDYLGIGAGAHSKITRLNAEQNLIIQRFYKNSHPKAYLVAKNNFIAKQTNINSTELALEFMLNALRLTNGVTQQLYSARTGLALTTLAKPVAQAIQLGLLADDPIYFKATPLGQQFLNDLLQLFYPANS